MCLHLRKLKRFTFFTYAYIKQKYNFSNLLTLKAIIFMQIDIYLVMDQ